MLITYCVICTFTDCGKKKGNNICLKNTPKMCIDIGLKREMMQ